MDNLKWYMISTVRGKEDQVIESLNNRIVAEGLVDDFDNNATDLGAFKIFLKPTLTAKEQQKKLAGEEYKIKYINLYPGYIFAKMHMTDKAWFLVRNTQYVTGLIGSSGKGAKPTPVSELEIRKMFKTEKQATEKFKSNKFNFGYHENDFVEIIDKPYEGYIGQILKLDPKNKEVTLLIERYGKKIEITLSTDSIRVSDTK
ncbi:transcriptional antiterminator NusG [Mycoplasmopsis mustelae]|uniref:Transcription termination/antitermination protein NusG n=1 Tax=Mycoplasmopsis mustelae TaxID=171289 RepID=A0A4R7UE26_9BACT|nr:transcription termination/antitermination protein NusG [Mycoplasmopsis mustelae]TDV23058.1 transcriptional antiterminator NusG [Mycoplasmopsis mustelae]